MQNGQIRGAVRRIGVLVSVATVFMGLSLVAGGAPANAASSPAGKVVAISAGLADTCAVTEGGAARCWGSGFLGQLGNGSTATSVSPGPVSGLSSGVIQISTQNGHSCALTASGAVLCWGNNEYGQNGDGTRVQSLAPVAVSGLSSGGAAVATGAGQSCAITTAGAALCWGDNSTGQLGTGNTSPSWVPTPVSGLSSGVVAISPAAEHTCALTEVGGVWCWGSNLYGQVGKPSGFMSTTPWPVPGLSSGVVAIASGDYHTCAVTSAGAVLCWGHNTRGQLGDGTTTNSSTPVAVAGLPSGVATVAAGAATTCALTASGAVVCWGYNSSGQVGNGTASDVSPPVQVTGLSSGATAIAVGEAHSCAVTSSGQVRCWGAADGGQLGTGSLYETLAPISGGAGAAAIVATDAGPAYSCDLSPTGAVSCVGANRSGQLGNGTKVSSSSPVAVSGATSGIAQVSAGADHTCAVTTAGAVRCWGHNTFGELGNGTTTDSTVPVAVSGLSSGIASVSAGNEVTCAVSTAGGVSCWGDGSNGKLGNGASASSSVPVAVSGLSSGVASVSVGFFSVCAVKTAGAVVCWGYNANGQLGNNSTTRSTVPVQVSGLASGASAVSVAMDFACALKTAGGVVCWGANASGQLGNGTNTASKVPVAVSGLSAGVSDLSSGDSSACAVNGGGVVCWGYNGTGQLGIGTTTASSVPIGVGTLSSGVAHVAVGGSLTCALTVAGAKWCWGANAPLQFGSDTWTPQQVSGASDYYRPLAISASVSPSPNSSGWRHQATQVSFTCSGGFVPLICPESQTEGEGAGQSVQGTVTDAAGMTASVSVPDLSVDLTAPEVVVTGVTDGASYPRGAVPSAGCATTDGLSGVLADAEVHTETTAPGTETVTCDGAVDIAGNAQLVPVTASYSVTNQPPVVGDRSVSAPRGTSTPLTLSGSDPDGDDLTFAVVDEPTKGALVCGGPALAACTYTPSAASGVDSFRYTANDGSAAADPATVTLTITNQAPVADQLDVAAPRGVTTPLVLGATDPNGDPTTFSVVDPPAKGELSCSGSGSCTYRAYLGTSGTDSFTYVADDGAEVSEPATVAITITNQAPVADARALQVGRRVATPITLSGSDGNGDPLVFRITSEPSKGAVTCGGVDGASCTYTSGPGATGSDSFRYVASDGSSDSASQTVTIDLVNVAPTANDQIVQAPRRVATPVILSATDPNSDVPSFRVVEEPTKGDLECAADGGSRCTYTARAGTSGSDSFTYVASDGEEDSAPAIVSLAITDQAPTASAMGVTAARGVALAVPLSGSDPNEDPITFSIVGQPTKGTLSCTGPGGAWCTYTARSTATGTDSFTYLASDGTSASAPATVDVTIGCGTSCWIAGRVSAAATGAPARGIRVQALGSGNTVVSTTSTASDGSFLLDPLTTGASYRLRYTDVSGAPSLITLTSGPIAAGTVGLTPSLLSFGHLSGTVTSASSGSAVGGIRVQAVLPDNSVVQAATSDAGGRWDLGGLTVGVTYTLRYADPSPSPAYVPATASAATGTTGIVQALDAYGHIDGTVTSASTGLPVAGIRVQAVVADNSIVQTTTTGLDGRFDLLRLPPGASYRIRYADTASSPIYVAAATAPLLVGTTGLTQVLGVVGHVDGRVTSSSTGQPVAGIRVQAVLADNSIVQVATTDAVGRYSLVGLTAGASYRLRAADTAALPAYAPTVLAGAVVAGTGTADISITPFGHLRGSVMAASDAALVQGARVVAVLPDNTVVETVTTDASGTFDLKQVLVGTTYRIRVNDAVGTRFPPTVSQPMVASASGLTIPV